MLFTPAGVNTIDDDMKTMAKAAGLDATGKRLTNNSIRKTTVRKLQNMLFPTATLLPLQDTIMSIVFSSMQRRSNKTTSQAHLFPTWRKLSCVAIIREDVGLYCIGGNFQWVLNFIFFKVQFQSQN